MKKLSKNLLSNSSGFTLVELMVVVAIIGILAAIAVPQYSKFQSKARQSEAKISLAAIYTAEQTYATEQGTYTQCLKQIGYDPNPIANQTQKRYYATGFFSDPKTCGPGSKQDISCATYTWNADGAANLICTFTSDSQFAANASASGTPVASTAVPATANIASKTTFTAGAAGIVSTSTSTADEWTVDQAKMITNTKPNL